MSQRPEKTLFDRILAWWRGLFARPSGERHLPTAHDSGAGRNSQAVPSSGAAPTVPSSDRFDADRDAGPGAAYQPGGRDGSASVARQDSAHSASGASDDAAVLLGVDDDALGGDAIQRSADDQEAELDRAVLDDADAVTAEYPSDAMDIDITPADGVGVEVAEAEGTDDGARGDASSVGSHEPGTIEGDGNVPVAEDEVSAQSAADGGSTGGVRGDGTTNTPEGYPVKGNASSKIYHLPGTVSYAGTKAEWCFATEQDAIAAGYRAPVGRSTKNPKEGAAGSSGQVTAASEGMQSHASTANRDSLAEMQKTLSHESSTRDGSSSSERSGLGSDCAVTDDPAPVRITPSEPSSTDTIDDVGGNSVQTEETPEPDGGGAARSGDEHAYSGAVPGDGSKSCPVGYPIKGNAGSMIYHIPGRASYDNTIPEWCFATEADAVNAGFRAPKR